MRETVEGLSRFGELSPKQVSSIMTSVSLLRDDAPRDLRRKLFDSFRTHATPSQFEQMSDPELSRTVLSFGFLAKEFGSAVAHTQVATALLGVVNERLPSMSNSKHIRDLIKGVTMLRIPICGELMTFFKTVNTSVLEFDEAVFALRAGIDYSFLDKELINRLTTSDSEPRHSSAARSLLYCAAMSGVGLDQTRIRCLLSHANLSDNDPKSLVTLWAASILGSPIAEVYPSLIHNGLNSASARDREMAASIANIAIPHRDHLTQSTIHAKLGPMLEQEYGPLVYEFEVKPGLVADCANIQKRLVIELHGPSHYLIDLSTESQVINGPTVRKSNKMRDHGWDVLDLNITRYSNRNRFQL